jgi:hypothetical protein
MPPVIASPQVQSGRMLDFALHSAISKLLAQTKTRRYDVMVSTRAAN